MEGWRGGRGGGGGGHLLEMFFYSTLSPTSSETLSLLCHSLSISKLKSSMDLTAAFTLGRKDS